MFSNMYAPEAMIREALLPLFNEDLIFTQQTIDDIDSSIFEDKNNDCDLAACLIIYGGYRVLSTGGRGKQQKIRPLWRVVVVTPSELYMTLCGVKMIEVVKVLKGSTLENTCSGLELVDDVREFNEPSFINSLVGIPSVYSFDTVV